MTAPLLRHFMALGIKVLNQTETHIIHGWMDDLQFKVHFNSTSVISGQSESDSKGCMYWNGHG